MNATWADGPLIAFDLETTGVDVTQARIVTASLIHRQPTPGGTYTHTTLTWLANPGVEIPDTASRVHGITTEHATRHGMDPAQVLADIHNALDRAWKPDVPLVAYNASYDLSVLHHELQRHGHGGLLLGGPVIDPYVIDKHVDRYRRGSRKLADVCRHYGVPLDDAHNSTADALAAAVLACTLVRRYGVIADLSLRELHHAQAQWHTEQCRSFAAYLRGKAATAALADAARATGDERAQHLNTIAELLDRADTVAAEAGTWPLRAPALEATP